MYSSAFSVIPISIFGCSICEWECSVFCCCVSASCPAADVIRSATGDDQEGVRLIFDMTFFFFVIVILLAIIEGDS